MAVSRSPYVTLFARLRERLGESEGARQMVDVLMLHRRYGSEVMFEAVAQALASGTYDYHAVALVAAGIDAPKPVAQPLRLHVVNDPEVPIPDTRHYDQLLKGGPDGPEHHRGHHPGPVPAAEVAQRARCLSLEEEAVRSKLSYSTYLSGLLEQELEDRAQRRAQRRLQEAHFPLVKRLADVEFEENHSLSAAQLAKLAEGRLHQPRRERAVGR